MLISIFRWQSEEVVVQLTQISSKSYMNAGKNWSCLLCRRELLLKRIMFNKICLVSVMFYLISLRTVWTFSLLQMLLGRIWICKNIPFSSCWLTSFALWRNGFVLCFSNPQLKVINTYCAFVCVRERETETKSVWKDFFLQHVNVHVNFISCL